MIALNLLLISTPGPDKGLGSVLQLSSTLFAPAFFTSPKSCKNEHLRKRH
jgi:hypothetical protein